MGIDLTLERMLAWLVWHSPYWDKWRTRESVNTSSVHRTVLMLLWQKSQSGSGHLTGARCRDDLLCRRGESLLVLWAVGPALEGICGSGVSTPRACVPWQCLGGEGVSPLAVQGKRPRTMRRKM